jgi:GDP-mannose 6-dehydrogenase
MGCLAQEGNHIIGVDTNENKLNLINSGKATIIEKDIDRIIREQWELKRIEATNDPGYAVMNTDLSVISVGTPSSMHGHLDLSYVFRVAEEIGAALKDKNNFHIISIRSTVMPGTNQQIGEIIENHSGKKRNEDFAVVSNPEFLREGSSVHDFYNPPVTVLGSENEKALSMMTDLYQFTNKPIVSVEINVAEIIKYVNNSYHALKICFANEIGNICKSLDIDSHEVMKLFVMDTQLNISPYYFKPGFAYGGSCLPKDLKGLVTIAHDNYIKSPVLESIEPSNNYQKQVAIEKITSFNKKKIGILGLSFKEGTDDLRYSPTVEIAEYLTGKGYHLLIYDYNVSISKLTATNLQYIEEHIPHLSNLMLDEMEDVICKSEIIVISHRFENMRQLIEKYPDKIFYDLSRVVNERFHNYQGINW